MTSVMSNLREQWEASGVTFTSTPDRLGAVHRLASEKLLDCIKSLGGRELVLQEGGVYLGCWLESTGTINAEVLSRFMPDTARATFEQFADWQREDGLIPYKMTADGAVFRQIQTVTPLARCIWNHYLLHGRDRKWLGKMYEALVRNDAWMAKHRNTRGTGCVEAFCTFDTGHDMSPRFWHVPDTPHMDDPTQYWPDSPVLPYLAPDLTAHAYCTRNYLGSMAEELGFGVEVRDEWFDKAEASLDALMNHCYNDMDGFFYDVDCRGEFVLIQSDVLLRVLACEVGDAELFEAALRRYLLNTRKFFAKYPLTSIALDDPRFDPASSYNSWAGPTNFLTLLRTPHAFEHHGHYVELTWILLPIVSAMARMSRFSQTLSPWTGEEGYTETYSPAILCVLDYVERLCGIMPAPEGQLYFTGLLPYPMDHGDKPGEKTVYTRAVDGKLFKLENTRESCRVYQDDQLICEFPYGIRLVTDRSGRPHSMVGMVDRTVEGTLRYNGKDTLLKIAGNEIWNYFDGSPECVKAPGVVPISY